MSDPTTQGIRATFASLSDAWKKGDGAAFSECCTEDVDFINLLGMHVKGRRGVAELHEKIFRGPYKDSTVEFTIQSIRFISPGASRDRTISTRRSLGTGEGHRLEHRQHFIRAGRRLLEGG